MKQFPTTREKWVQPNINDVSGDLFVTKGVDLTDNQGKVRLGKRLILGFNSVGQPLFNGAPTAFREFNVNIGNRIIGVAGTGLIESSNDYPGGGFIGFPNSYPLDLSTNSDLEIFGSDLYLTGDQNLYKLTFGGTNWSSSLYASLNSGSTHQLCYYQGRLYVTNLNAIYSWDGSTMSTTPGVYSCTIPSPAKNIIRFIKAGANKIWIGTIGSTNSAGSKGYLYEWDGTSSTPAKEHKLDNMGAVSCVIKDDVPWVMDVYGRLLAWNGGTFIEKGRLNRRVNQLFDTGGFATGQNGFVHPNGMAVVNGKINILIDGRHFDSTNSQEETIPSGVWEYDENMGLYHKHAFGLSTAAGTITDFGANRISQAGALIEANYPDPAAARNGTLVAGADYYTDATTVVHGVFTDDSNDTLQKAGYIITPKIEATDDSPYNLPSVEDMWLSLYTIYRKLLNSTDKIVPKYRTEQKESVEAIITWLSTTTFSVPVTSVDVTQYWTSGTGGEVELMQGVGAGKCAHITNVVNAGVTYTVTVDEIFTGATGTAVARFQNWKKISAITPNNQSFNSDTISTKSTWIQFKVFMNWTGRNEIERIISDKKNSTPVK